MATAMAAAAASKFTVLVLLTLADQRGPRPAQMVSSVRMVSVIILRAVTALTTHVPAE